MVVVGSTNARRSRPSCVLGPTPHRLCCDAVGCSSRAVGPLATVAGRAVVVHVQLLEARRSANLCLINSFRHTRLLRIHALCSAARVAHLIPCANIITNKSSRRNTLGLNCYWVARAICVRAWISRASHASSRAALLIVVGSAGELALPHLREFKACLLHESYDVRVCFYESYDVVHSTQPATTL